jgi:hypothetical protein
MKDFVNTELFQELKPWFAIQVYDRDGGHAKPRKRIELKSGMPQELVAKALAFTAHCPACGRRMSPFRLRSRAGNQRGGNPQHIYFAAACPEQPTQEQVERWKRLSEEDLDKDPSPMSLANAMQDALAEAANSCRTCCKGAAATNIYKAVIAAVGAP